MWHIFTNNSTWQNTINNFIHELNTLQFDFLTIIHMKLTTKIWNINNNHRYKNFFLLLHLLWIDFKRSNCLWSFLKFFLHSYNCFSKPETESNKWSFSIDISIILSFVLNNSSKTQSKTTKKHWLHFKIQKQNDKFTSHIHKNGIRTVHLLTFVLQIQVHRNVPKNVTASHL